MGSKIGRNELCPCESGEKYKKCCLPKGIIFNKDKSEMPSNSISTFLKKYNSLDLSIAFAALSIDPTNHGKDLRLEYLTALSLSFTNFSDNLVEIDRLKKEVDYHMPSYHHEDPPENTFTENIVSSIGNNVVYCGNYDQGVYTLQNQIKSLTYFSEEYDNSVNEECHHTLNICLLLSDVIAHSNGHARDIIGNKIQHETIEFSDQLIERKHRLFFEWNTLEKLSKIYNIDHKYIKNLVLDIDEVKDTKPKLGVGELSPVLLKPFIANKGGLWVISPTSIVVALQHYIWNTSLANEFSDLLLEKYHLLTISDLEFQLVFKLKWKKIEYVTQDIDENFVVLVYRFDTNKISVVIIEKDFLNKDGGAVDKHNFRGKEFRRNELVSNIQLDFPSDELLVIDLFNSIGNSNMRFVEDLKDHLYLFTTLYTFIQAIRTGKLDQLYFYYYCKSRDIFEDGLSTSPYMGFREKFPIFIKNDSFYLNDERKPNFVIYEFGTFTKIINAANIREDLRVGFKNVDNYPNPVLVNIIKENETFPRYAQIEGFSKHLEFCLLYFKYPLWIISNTSIVDTKPEHKGIVWQYNEAICYWLFETKDIVEQVVRHIERPIDIKYKLLGDLSGRKMKNDNHFLSNASHVETEILEYGILISIPVDMTKLELENDNTYEVEIIKTLFKGLIEYLNKNEIQLDISFDVVEELLSEKMSGDRKKMILPIDTSNNVSFDPRNIGSIRRFQNASQQLVMDEIIPGLGALCPPIGAIESKVEKKKFCVTVVTKMLLPYLRKQVSQYDSTALLIRLLVIYEAFVHEKALFQYRLPYRLECFGGYEDIINEMSQKAKDDANSTIAIRCLIEHLSAESNEGQKEVPFSVIDNLVSTMSLIVFWGSTGDIIEFDLFDTELSILPSGRIGTNSHDIVDSYFSEYSERRSIQNLQDACRVDPNLYSIALDADKLKSLNLAFKEDYGFAYDVFTELTSVLIEFAFGQHDVQYTTIRLSEIFLTIKPLFTFEISEEEVFHYINFSTIMNRGSVDNLPKGYKYSDIMPWRYNRRLSYMYKPIVSYTLKNEIYLAYTPRHLSESYAYLTSQIGKAKFNFKQGGKLEGFIGNIGNLKGALFQEVIEKIFSNFDNSFIDTEVGIKPRGKLQNDKDLGDVDILFISSREKIILSIECKNTEAARNSKEMIEEVSYYLKKDKGYIFKHKRREQWLQSNINKLAAFTSIDLSSFRVGSLFVTKEILPINISKSTDLKMAFINLYDLEIKSLEWIIKRVFE